MSPLQGFYITGVLTMGFHPWLQPVTPFGVKVRAIKRKPSRLLRWRLKLFFDFSNLPAGFCLFEPLDRFLGDFWRLFFKCL